VFGIDEGGRAAATLHLRDDRQRERGLAGGFRPVDLDDAAFRQATDAERDVEPKRARGDDFDVVAVGVAKAHDRALAELLLDLAERCDQGLLAVFFHCVARESGVGAGLARLVKGDQRNGCIIPQPCRGRSEKLPGITGISAAFDRVIPPVQGLIA